MPIKRKILHKVRITLHTCLSPSLIHGPMLVYTVNSQTEVCQKITASSSSFNLSFVSQNSLDAFDFPATQRSPRSNQSGPKSAQVYWITSPPSLTEFQKTKTLGESSKISDSLKAQETPLTRRHAKRCMSLDTVVDVSPDIPLSNIRKRLKSNSHWTMLQQKENKRMDLLEDMEMALFMEELETNSTARGLERSISLPTVKSPLTVLSTKVSPIQRQDVLTARVRKSPRRKENEGPAKENAIGGLVKAASNSSFSDEFSDDFLFDPQIEEALQLAEVHSLLYSKESTLCLTLYCIQKKSQASLEQLHLPKDKYVRYLVLEVFETLDQESGQPEKVLS